MTLLLTNRQDKRKSLYVIEQLFQQFMYPTITQDQRQAIDRHLHNMGHRPEDMTVDLVFEIFPETGMTRISLSFGFAANAPKPN